MDYRVQMEVDGHVLVAELRGRIEALQEYLAGQGIDLADLEPAGGQDEDRDCE